MIKKVYSRILPLPEQSFFLLGPRGTGKSTWIRQRLPDAKTIDLLSEDTYQRLLASPGLLAAELRAVPQGQWVVIDEVQRLPNLLNEVHRFIEERSLRFVLCGSSARKLKRSGVNLLAGRALHRAMHPFVPEELGSDFHLDRALRTGLLAIVWDAPSPGETLEAYARMYLKEEIQAEALVRNLPGFARFLPIAALYHGQTFNSTNVAREAGVSRSTVHGYLDILQETLLCFQLPAFEAKLRVRERKLPKLYWCDPGLVQAMKQRRGELSSEERGALFEGLVVQLVRAYKDYLGLCDDLYFWASGGGSAVEVDLLLARGGEFLGVEIKSGRLFSDAWCKGLRALRDLKGLTRRIIVYPEGPALRTEDGIEVFSYQEFASLIASETLWPA